MNKFRIAPTARQDLRRILDYLMERNPAAAGRLWQNLSDGFILLARFPDMGRPRFGSKLKIFVIDGYVVAYRGQRPEIEIIRIIHSKRYVEGLLKETLH